MIDLSKLRIEGTGANTVVLWDEDQIAFAVDDGDPPMLHVSMTEEDFENGELAEESRAELRLAREAILADLQSRGFTFEETP
jgi:hypothetical protein